VSSGPPGQLSARVVARAGARELDVELAVEPGETLAVLGPNGAGKTTLLRVLAGLHPLDAGAVAVGNHVLADAAAGIDRPPEERSVGVVFQDLLLFPDLDAADNVAFGLRAAGRRKAAARHTAVDWLARVGLADRARRRPSQLSGGEAQRVALARALAPAPAVLLLDEPLRGLEADERARLLRLPGPRRTIVIASRYPASEEGLASHVCLLRGGRVAVCAPISELEQAGLPLAMRGVEALAERRAHRAMAPGTAAATVGR